MITDLFTSSNQSLSPAALLSSIDTGIKTQGLQGAKTGSDSGGFAGILSQAMGSDLSEIGKGSSLSISLPKSSYKAESFNPSSLLNTNQRSSFQNPFELRNKSFSSEAQDRTRVNSYSQSAETENKVQVENGHVAKEKEDIGTEKELNQQLSKRDEKTEESPSFEDKVCLELETKVLEENQKLNSLVISKEAPDEDEVTEIEIAETEEITQPEVSFQAASNVELKEPELEVKSEESVEKEERLSETRLTEDFAETEKLSDKDEEDKLEVAESHKLVNAMEERVVAESNTEAISQNKEESLIDNSNHEVVKNLNLPKESKLDAKENLSNKESSEALELDENGKAIKEKTTETKYKANQETKFDEVVESLKEEGKTIPEESLRKEFSRLTNQDEKANVDNSGTGLNNQGTENPEQASQTAATVTDRAVENLNRIFNEFIGKTEASSGKDKENHLTAGNLEGIAKGSNQNQNNSGMNSGFYSQSGNTSTYNAKGEISQNPNTATASFSELLTKAEMVKTKDGAKVMNIELEQEGLGKLELELTSKDGKITAKLSAESDIAKAKLEELTPKIKENLIEKGVNLTQISVDISSKDADGNASQYQNSGKKNKSNGLDKIKNRTVKEIIEKNILPNLRRKALNIQSVDIKV